MSRVGFRVINCASMALFGQLDLPTTSSPLHLCEALKRYQTTHVHHFHEGPVIDNAKSFMCCNCDAMVIIGKQIQNQTGALDARQAALHPTHHWHKELIGQNTWRFACCGCSDSFECTVAQSPLEEQLITLHALTGQKSPAYLQLLEVVLELLGGALDMPERRTKPVLVNSKRFQTQVGSVPGGIDLLESCGFMRSGTTDNPTLVLPDDFSLVEDKIRLSRYRVKHEINQIHEAEQPAQSQWQGIAHIAYCNALVTLM